MINTHKIFNKEHKIDKKVLIRFAVKKIKNLFVIIAILFPAFFAMLFSFLFCIFYFFLLCKKKTKAKKEKRKKETKFLDPNKIKKVTSNLNNLTLSQRANPNKAYPINAFAMVGLRLAAWINAPKTIPIPAPTPA